MAHTKVKVITKIERQKKNHERHSVFIDGAFAFGIGETDLLYYKLSEGAEISEERLAYIVDQVIYTKALDKAMVYLSYKARTTREIKDRLSREDYGSAVVERVMDTLAKYHYVDDEKYTVDYIQSRIRISGYGTYRIKQELWKKGITGQAVDSVLVGMSPDELSAAKKMLEKKLRYHDPEDLDRRERKRCSDYLSRRGFSYDIIKKALADYVFTR